jgi:hypothetical protein
MRFESDAKGFRRQFKKWKETVKKRSLQASVVPGAHGQISQQRSPRQVVAQVERASGECRSLMRRDRARAGHRLMRRHGSHRAFHPVAAFAHGTVGTAAAGERTAVHPLTQATEDPRQARRASKSKGGQQKPCPKILPHWFNDNCGPPFCPPRRQRGMSKPLLP